MNAAESRSGSAGPNTEIDATTGRESAGTARATVSPTAAGYLAVRKLTERLAAPLSAEDQVVQSFTEASPTKWHRGHTTWFFEEFILSQYSHGYEPRDPRYRYLFNSYYEAVGDRQPRAERGLLTRPSCNQVAHYRAQVDADMVALLSSGQLDNAGIDLVELGLHHEQQHQELLLMDVKHLLSRNPLTAEYVDPSDYRNEPDLSEQVDTTSEPKPGSRQDRRKIEHRDTGIDPKWISHAGGRFEIGHDPASKDGESDFSFDNEGPIHSVWVEPFEIAAELVTCGDWMAFIADGGYKRSELWLSDGWATVAEESWESPLYWDTGRRSADSPTIFTLSGQQEVQHNQPVSHVSYYEADAYARWADARLPTEAEWELVASKHWSPECRGDSPRLHPAEQGSPSTDPGQFCGEVWQWTSSAYLPYPKFVAAAGAVGEYNGKFMVNQHVMRGGSCITPPGHDRVTYRNFFPAAARWQFGGVRLARD